MGLIRSPESDPVLVEFADAVGSKGPVAIRGGGTHWDIGGEPDSAARVVVPPEGIVEIRSEEMTVEVRAGTTVTELHEALRPLGQRTSLPEIPGSTVGGTIAVGRSGIARLGRGQARDAVLQIHYVSSEGRLITAGGPTVKNVSGFDLCRLMVGSLGTLGCMADMILRTRPIPEVEVWHLVDGIDPTAVFRTCRSSASILWDGTSTWVLSAGHAADVEADLATLAALAASARAKPPAESNAPDIPPHRWSRRPSEARSMSPETEPFLAEIGVGMVHLHRAIDTPDRPPPLVALEQRVKSALDPTGRFNPGRRAGGV